MKLIVSKENVGFLTASYVRDQIKAFNPTADKPFIIAFPTGGTAVDMYKYLVQFHKEGTLSFDNVISFNLDEYVALPVTHPESYHSFMWRNLFSHINMPKEHINILDGNAKDLDLECKKYEEKIASLGGINLFLGGVGQNGHIAFNEPNSPFDTLTHVVTLTENTRQANVRFFDDDINQVPTKALSMGLGTVMSAKQVVIMATGDKKAEALKHAFAKGTDLNWPITILQEHNNAFIVADKEAVSQIDDDTRKTYEVCCFKK